MKPTLLILAAGMGSRYGGVKQIDKFGPNGECLMDYSLYDAVKAGFGKIVFIVREEIEKDVRELFDHKLKPLVEVEYAIQRLTEPSDIIPAGIERGKPWGTGHAVIAAADKINEPFAVINADDFYGPEAYKILADYLSSDLKEGDYSMVGYILGNTLSDFGSVSRGCCKVDANGNLSEVIERTKIQRNAAGEVEYDDATGKGTLPDNSVVSMNFWGFTPDVFKRFKDRFADFVKANSNDPKSEFFIPLPVQEMIEDKSAKVKVFETDSTWFGVTYTEDKEFVSNELKKLIAAGVYPEKLWK
ncbi:sugar phosphate nucleotidyltransferase [Solitalea sp. MAHUQ-68]|uniref:Sugar phosphate nucleotidyltransferase n=1 Tax=Solitalea agri TaxID=2953739 RepID=A0A9X2F385_9SPHI|nr:sugar phosphate nucleotidyltransferase [Solitalea agri]MCO4293832.1 sugar phosphate nucleotidyltransferase [Solitalea agri]